MHKPKSPRGRTAMASIRAELPEIEAGIQPAAMAARTFLFPSDSPAARRVSE
jgi:hypothetical protein